MAHCLVCTVPTSPSRYRISFLAPWDVATSSKFMALSYFLASFSYRRWYRARSAWPPGVTRSLDAISSKSSTGLASKL